MLLEAIRHSDKSPKRNSVTNHRNGSQRTTTGPQWTATDHMWRN